MTAYDDLMAHQRETQALAQVAGRLGWDQETMMPRGAAPQRGEESVLHARRTDPRIESWLAQIAPQALDDQGRANLRHIRRSFERASKVPAALPPGSHASRRRPRASGQKRAQMMISRPSPQP